MLKKVIRCSFAVGISFCAIIIALFMALNTHAVDAADGIQTTGLLMDGGKCRVTINSEEGTFKDFYTITFNGQTITPGDTFTFDSSNAGDIVITPKRGYRVSSVRLSNSSYMIVWGGNNPATKQQIDSESYVGEYVYNLVDERVKDNFFLEKNANGTPNYYGPLTMTREFLTKDPYVGWHKGEPIIFPRDSFSPQLGDHGILTLNVTVIPISLEHISIKETGSYEPFKYYSYRGTEYEDLNEMVKKINDDIDRHYILDGDNVTIGFYGDVMGISCYTYPDYPALKSFSKNWAMFQILADHELTIFIVYNHSSKGIIIPAKTEHLKPDDPPSLQTSDEFFNTCVEDVEVSVEGLDTVQTFTTYDSLNEHLKSLPVGTNISLDFGLTAGFYLEESSVGTIEDGGMAVSGLTLSGPEPVFDGETEDGVPVLKGTWSGPTVGSGDGQHFDPSEVVWNQEYTEGEPLTVELTYHVPTEPQTKIIVSGKSFSPFHNDGITAFIYASDTDFLAKNATVKISGSLISTTNPSPDYSSYGVLPTKTYEVNSSNYYCGYWFAPQVGSEIQYQYTFKIRAVLTSGSHTDIEECIVTFDNNVDNFNPVPNPSPEVAADTGRPANAYSDPSMIPRYIREAIPLNRFEKIIVQ